MINFLSKISDRILGKIRTYYLTNKHNKFNFSIEYLKLRLSLFLRIYNIIGLKYNYIYYKYHKECKKIFKKSIYKTDTKKYEDKANVFNSEKIIIFPT